MAGEHDFRRESGDEQRRKAVDFIVHEDYKDDGVGPDDIALILVDRPFELNGKVKQIKLPESGSYPVGRAIVSGWGSTSRIPVLPTRPNILQVCSYNLY